MINIEKINHSKRRIQLVLGLPSGGLKAIKNFSLNHGRFAAIKDTNNTRNILVVISEVYQKSLNDFSWQRQHLDKEIIMNLEISQSSG